MSTVCEPWPAVYPCAPCVEEAPDPAGLAAATEVAAQVLDALSGRQFGLCAVALRPCRRDVADGLGPPLTPWAAGGQWTAGCLHGRARCECTTSRSIALPSALSSVEAVWLDGAALDPSAYTLRGRWLYRTDGRLWPACQDMAAGDHDPGAFTVEAKLGKPVPAAGQAAVGALACELLASGTDGCALPKNVQSVSRQGVSVALLDLTETIRAGGTGISAVDLWLHAVNPGRLPSNPAVWSPDLPVYGPR